MFAIFLLVLVFMVLENERLYNWDPVCTHHQDNKYCNPHVHARRALTRALSCSNAWPFLDIYRVKVIII